MIAHDLLDFSHSRRLHMLGIGGSGMTPFARLLNAEGHQLSGSDRNACPLLAGEGIDVSTGDLLPEAVEGVVRSAAVPLDHPAVVEARLRGLPVLKYARAVGMYSRSKRTLAVAGTHGKTTTTAMLSYVLRRAGYDPSFLVGGSVPQLSGPGRGRSDWLTLEACEFDRSFLHFSPEIAVVTNLEADHLDYYKDLVEITAAFRSFAAQVERLLVVHETLWETVGRAGGVRAKVKTFGPSPDADVRVLPGTIDGLPVKLQLPGFHNLLNAAAVYVVATEIGVEREVAVRALEEFAGVGRRLQMVGQPRGISVVDDYAHHPTEVAAGLRALREAYAPRRLWVVFQPHQYSRLRLFLQDFAIALSEADRIVVPDVFAARDDAEDRSSISSGDLVAKMRGLGADAVHIAESGPDFGGVVNFVRAQAQTGDVVVTMGAGDIGHVAGQLAETL